MTIFHEVYSVYYLAVEQMIALALDGQLNQSRAWELCSRLAFKESFDLIWESITREDWHVIPTKGELPYTKVPSRPLTLLEKRWLKAILLDPRMKLFDIDMGALAEVEPLFSPEDWHVANSYSDGDSYDSPTYITTFRTVLKATKEKSWLEIHMTNQAGNLSHVFVQPQEIEYSVRDDKFRILCAPQSEVDTVNIGRILSCVICDELPSIRHRRKKEDAIREIVLAVSDKRNGLERVMTHFSAYDKSLMHQADGSYQLTIRYHPDEESDLLLQVLSFGSVIRVLSPASFIQQISDRIQNQLKWKL